MSSIVSVVTPARSPRFFATASIASCRDESAGTLEPRARGRRRWPSRSSTYRPTLWRLLLGRSTCHPRRFQKTTSARNPRHGQSESQACPKWFVNRRSDPSADDAATVTDGGVSDGVGSLDWFDLAQPAGANTKISAIKEADAWRSHWLSDSIAFRRRLPPTTSMHSNVIPSRPIARRRAGRPRLGGVESALTRLSQTPQIGRD